MNSNIHSYLICKRKHWHKTKIVLLKLKIFVCVTIMEKFFTVSKPFHPCCAPKKAANSTRMFVTFPSTTSLMIVIPKPDANTCLCTH